MNFPRRKLTDTVDDVVPAAVYFFYSEYENSAAFKSFAELDLHCYVIVLS